MKYELFYRKVARTIFLSHNLPTLGILHTKFGLIWTTSWPDKRDLFLKFIFREIQKVPYEILTFFLGKLHQKFFLFYTLIKLVILHAEFGLIWTTPWPDEKDLFLKFLFREIQKVPYEILTFFLSKLHQKFFFIYILIKLVILHAEFGLIWTTPWPDKKDLFLKIIFREIRKVPYEILTFFLGKLHQQFFLFYILIILVILHAEFGLIWTTPWPDEKDLFLKFLFREIQKVPYEILSFFLGKLY